MQKLKLETMYAILKYNYRKEVHLANKDNKHYYISKNHIRAGAAGFYGLGCKAD